MHSTVRYGITEQAGARNTTLAASTDIEQRLHGNEQYAAH